MGAARHFGQRAGVRALWGARALEPCWLARKRRRVALGAGRPGRGDQALLVREGGQRCDAFDPDARQQGACVVCAAVLRELLLHRLACVFARFTRDVLTPPAPPLSLVSVLSLQQAALSYSIEIKSTGGSGAALAQHVSSLL